MEVKGYGLRGKRGEISIRNKAENETDTARFCREKSADRNAWKGSQMFFSAGG